MAQQKKLYWVGIRESELSDTGGLFDGSITIFGSNKGNNYSFEKEQNIRIDYSNINKEAMAFINKTAKKIMHQNPECDFLLYYPMEAEEYGALISEHAICINDFKLMDLLENKIYTKLCMSKIVPVIPFTTITGIELEYNNLCDAFPDENRFVVQGTFSCGGSGTWLISSLEDISRILPNITPYNIYTVTPYKNESISVNLHLIIYKQDIVLFPASVQLICENQNHLCYSGADFLMINQLPQEIIEKIYSYGMSIGKYLQTAGYRGICGIDFLTTENEVFFTEINARFQSSSFLINEALKDVSLPSLQKLHMDAFVYPAPLCQIGELSISKSFFSYSFHEDTKEQAKYIWEIQKLCPEVCYCIDDELDWNVPMEDNTYLFKLVFNTNIACVAPNYACRLYNGMDYSFNLIKELPWHQQLKRFKVLLLNQGIRITERASRQLLNNGGPNHKIFQAIDLSVEDKLYLNVPYKVDFSELSPFEVDFQQKEYQLNYYGKPIAKVFVRTNDPLAQNLTKNNIPYDEISYLGVDRLRIHQRSGCFFKEKNIGCTFCDIELSEKFSFEDIKEVIQAYKNHPAIRHFLVGGGSQDPSDSFEELTKIIKYIHELTAKPIYLMSIPPEKTEVLMQLKDAGVTEVAFNIEIFDRNLAKKYMPGKGMLNMKRYESAFKAATELWGKTGNVRSALIIGLEPKESVLAGVEYLCKLGVSPILALLKPSNQLNNFWAPGSGEVLDIWECTETICQKYGIPLGPSCHYCEDNVLKVSLEDNRV